MKPLRQSLVRSAATLGALVLSGCYSYLSVPIEQIRPGMEVRARIPVTRSVGSAAVTEESVAFEGIVVAVNDTLALQTRTQRPVGTFREMVTFDTVLVTRSSLQGIEERVFSRPRTVVFTAALLGGAALVLAAFSGLAGGQGLEDGDPPPTGAVAPTVGNPGGRGGVGFSVPVPWGGR